MGKRPMLGMAAASAVGLAAGVAITRHAHRRPITPGWAKRVGRTRFRRANLPVGGTLVLLVAAALHRAGRTRAAHVVAALGLGAAAGPVATGLADPLPPGDAAK